MALAESFVESQALVKAPPRILLDSVRDNEALSGPRNLSGWFTLAFMFVAVVGLTLASSLSPDSESQFFGYDQDLKSLVRPAQQSKTAIKALTDDTPDSNGETLASLEKKVARIRSKEVLGSALYAAILTEEHKPVPAQDVERLKHGKTAVSRAMGQIYGSQTLSPAVATSLAATLKPNGLFVTELARVQALEKSGDRRARARIIHAPSIVVTSIVAGTFLALMLGCGGVWITYISFRSDGKWVPLGVPLDRISLNEADRLAVRAAQLLASFLGIELVVEMALRHAPSGARELVQGSIMLAAVYVLIRFRPASDPLGFRRLGLYAENVWSNIRWGISGFLAELPPAMILAAVLVVLLKFLPSPQHPAELELTLKHDWLTIAGTLFTGTIVAPIWEEIMFRGFLFPALARVTRSVPIGAVISSVLFATVHPQGIAMWAALATTGLMSCAVSYQTKSLVPCIVLHFCHNMTLMLITIISN